MKFHSNFSPAAPHAKRSTRSTHSMSPSLRPVRATQYGKFLELWPFGWDHFAASEMPSLPGAADDQRGVERGVPGAAGECVRRGRTAWSTCARSTWVRTGQDSAPRSAPAPFHPPTRPTARDHPAHGPRPPGGYLSAARRSRAAPTQTGPLRPIAAHVSPPGARQLGETHSERNAPKNPLQRPGEGRVASHPAEPETRKASPSGMPRVGRAPARHPTVRKSATELSFPPRGGALPAEAPPPEAPTGAPPRLRASLRARGGLLREPGPWRRERNLFCT